MSGPDIDALLARRAMPVSVYFRDDDAGWGDQALLRLLDTFARHQIPIDLALIPRALQLPLERTLRAAAGRQALGIHQHGYEHANHESAGRKSEFGPSRDDQAQASDIAAGAEILRQALDGLTQPLFTPPWNRCTQPTVDALVAAGIRALSRDARAAPLALHGLRSMPVHLDWQKRASGCAAFENALANADTVGIMLHHAVMDEGDHLELVDLLVRLRAHPRVQCIAMGELLHEPEEISQCES